LTQSFDDLCTISGRGTSVDEYRVSSSILRKFESGRPHPSGASGSSIVVAMSSKSPRVAIVTGAASGMGEGLSRNLISKGWAVACVDVQEQAGKALVAELGSNAHFIKCDIADYDDQARMYTEVWKKWGRLDALLQNAGIVDRSSIYILDHRGSDRYADTYCVPFAMERIRRR